ncbi:uncharacterized protein [Drosophila kikkawai]|uniref:Uncharacterized protein n=1 Tax=Drosophila kikkawai TaxID=30033 RepID=A0A6P4HZB8_DROKI|nr:uncharacterized protein LOC108073862 isoform X1 [Drosophila kikkawai]
MFLTKSSSARHSLLLLLLALCCLSSAFGAKITKKVVKVPTENGEKSEAESDAAAVADAAPAEEANDEDDEEDDDDDDDEEEEAAAASADKEAEATTATSGNHKNPNAVQASTDPTDLSVWGMVRTLWGWLRSDLSESLFGDDDDSDDGKPASGSSAVEGRTFGKIRRLQMALIPIIFKFGVLSAMVAFLVAIGMKSLFLLKVLVVMNAIAILGKFITLKSSLFGQYEHTAPSFNYPGWNPHAKESWGSTGVASGPGGHPPSKEIHLHIHGNAQTQAQLAGQGYQYESQTGGWASRSDPYGAYAPTGQFSTDVQQPEAGVVREGVPNTTDPMSLLPTKYRARTFIR